MRVRNAMAILAVALGIAACIPDVIPNEPPPDSRGSSSSGGTGGASSTTSTTSASSTTAATSGTTTGSTTTTGATTSTGTGAGGACPGPVAGCGDTAWVHWKPIDEHSYTLAGSTVVDDTTKLTWTFDIGPQGDHAAAVAYCQGLSTGGCTDWRLPTRTELASLLDYASTAQSALWDPIFDPSPADFYWASTASIDPTFPDNFWYVNFTTGVVGGALKTNMFHVRCVR